MPDSVLADEHLVIGDLYKFLDIVGTRLAEDGRPNDYDKFLDVLRDHAYKQIDKSQMIERLSIIIPNLPALFQEFADWLIPERRPEYPTKPPSPTYHGLGRVFHITVSESAETPTSVPSSPGTEEAEASNEQEPPQPPMKDDFFSVLHYASTVQTYFQDKPLMFARFLALLAPNANDLPNMDLPSEDIETVIIEDQKVSPSLPSNKIDLHAKTGGLLSLYEKALLADAFSDSLILRSLSSKDAKEQLLSLEGPTAVSCLDRIVKALKDKSLGDEQLDRERYFALRRILVDLSIRSRQLPSSTFVTGVICENRDSVAGGAFADIYHAKLGSTVVALKRLRVFRDSVNYDKLTMGFCREALVWQQLEHKHILPCLGIDHETFKPHYCMVAPWLHNGDVVNFIRSRSNSNDPGPPLPLHQWILEILLGLDYLHDERIVHGDLRSPNILIDDSLHIRIADFGFARLRDSLAPPSIGSSSHTNPRWLPPEVVRCESPVSFESDIYAFGCVWLEICTLHPPLRELHGNMVHASKMENLPPRWPGQKEAEDGIPLMLDPDDWTFVRECWNAEPQLRPPIAILLAKTRAICDTVCK